MTIEEAIGYLIDKRNKIIWDDSCYDDAWIEALDMAIIALEQEQNTGHWIYDYISADGHKTYHCSECGCYLKPKHSEPLNSFKWCSLCGAKMIDPQKASGEMTNKEALVKVRGYLTEPLPIGNYYDVEKESEEEE